MFRNQLVALAVTVLFVSALGTSAAAQALTSGVAPQDVEKKAAQPSTRTGAEKPKGSIRSSEVFFTDGQPENAEREQASATKHTGGAGFKTPLRPFQEIEPSPLNPRIIDGKLSKGDQSEPVSDSPTAAARAPANEHAWVFNWMPGFALFVWFLLGAVWRGSGEEMSYRIMAHEAQTRVVQMIMAGLITLTLGYAVVPEKVWTWAFAGNIITATMVGPLLALAVALSLPEKRRAG